MREMARWTDGCRRRGSRLRRSTGVLRVQPGTPVDPFRNPRSKINACEYLSRVGFEQGLESPTIARPARAGFPSPETEMRPMTTVLATLTGSEKQVARAETLAKTWIDSRDRTTAQLLRNGSPRGEPPMPASPPPAPSPPSPGEHEGTCAATTRSRDVVGAWIASSGVDPRSVEWYADAESGRTMAWPEFGLAPGRRLRGPGQDGRRVQGRPDRQAAARGPERPLRLVRPGRPVRLGDPANRRLGHAGPDGRLGSCSASRRSSGSTAPSGSRPGSRGRSGAASTGAASRAPPRPAPIAPASFATRASPGRRSRRRWESACGRCSGISAWPRLDAPEHVAVILEFPLATAAALAVSVADLRDP